ncbi:FHA domain-containing protein [Brevibacterium sp. CS2]|uniref:FHA domain-containing protein n=1 Tax=Brevibacterium sp. CS2 TaxID=2575923 RepID=UPI0020C75C03|nr:FHA domain-containing protein [Brevibacterium sp. CS2]
MFGRSSSSADIVLDDPGVSRRHFEIAVSGDQATATDLGSTNGTLVDGRRITSLPLSDGITLTAGDTDVVFRETETGGR